LLPVRAARECLSKNWNKAFSERTLRTTFLALLSRGNRTNRTWLYWSVEENESHAYSILTPARIWAILGLGWIVFSGGLRTCMTTCCLDERAVQ
jgi:hypothetical protein